MDRLVYRLENEKGEGPFATGDLYEYMDRDYHCNEFRFPTPLCDSALIPVINGERAWSVFFPWACACPTVRALLDWFPANVIRQLRKHGFKIVVYRVDTRHVCYGQHTNNQVSFNKDYATVVSRH